MGYREALINFLSKLQEREVELTNKDKQNKYMSFATPATFSVMSGSKYDRIVRTYGGSMSAYAFIDKKTGAIMKVASWKQPDVKKYERGNIFNEDCLRGTTRYGVVYLK